MKSQIYDEARLVDLTDEQLLDMLGFLWEESKRLQEAMVNDPEVIRREDELKAYKTEKYLDVRKGYMRRLKGARAFAKARGLSFKLPERTSDEEQS